MVAETAKQNEALKAETRDLVAQAAEQTKARAAEVTDMVSGFHAEQAETAAAWQGLLGKMRGVHGNGHKAPAKPKPAKGAKEGPSTAGLKAKVLALIAGSEEGMKLAAVAEQLGFESWRDLLPVARELVEEGKVEKEGSVYFA